MKDRPAKCLEIEEVRTIVEDFIYGRLDAVEALAHIAILVEKADEANERFGSEYKRELLKRLAHTLDAAEAP